MNHNSCPEISIVTMHRCFSVVILLFCTRSAIFAQSNWSDLGSSRGDDMLEAYFLAETAELTTNCLSDIETLDDWQAKKGEYRRQLFEMLGLDPLPQKDAAEGDRYRQGGSRGIHRRERPLPVAARAVRDRQPVRAETARPASFRRSCMSAVTGGSRSTASATATRRATSITAAGSRGTDTSA